MTDRTPPARMISRVSSQVSLRVSGQVSDQGIFRSLQARVMRWAFTKERDLGRPTEKARRGERFEIDAGDTGQVEAARLDEPNRWACRLIERSKDPNRIWTTEVLITENSLTEAMVGCRLLCTQLEDDRDSIPRSIPRFVREIAFTQAAFLDGRQTSPAP